MRTFTLGTVKVHFGKKRKKIPTQSFHGVFIAFSSNMLEHSGYRKLCCVFAALTTFQWVCREQDDVCFFLCLQCYLLNLNEAPTSNQISNGKHSLWTMFFFTLPYFHSFTFTVGINEGGGSE